MWVSIISTAQSVITFKPGPDIGEDANLENTYGCTPSGNSAPWEVQNAGRHYELACYDWTLNAQGCAKGTIRGLIRFSGLDSFIGQDITISNATLKLYTGPNSLYNNYGNSYPDFPEPNNGYIQRVTSYWHEDTVIWNTAPTTTMANEAHIPASPSRWNWAPSINVTEMVKDIISSGENYGFMLGLNTEEPLRQLLFASSDHPNSDLWPELTITYIETLKTPYDVSNNTDNFLVNHITPNPSQTSWNLSIISKNPISVEILIYDMMGKNLKNNTHTISGLNQITLSADDLPPGTYLLEIRSKQFSIKEKLIRR